MYSKSISRVNDASRRTSCEPLLPYSALHRTIRWYGRTAEPPLASVANNMLGSAHCKRQNRTAKPSRLCSEAESSAHPLIVIPRKAIRPLGNAESASELTPKT